MDKKLTNAFKWIVSVLHKYDIPFQISGGLAANIYGSKRKINDIDIDIPEDKMELLLPDIEKHITFGPARYKDDKWDLKLITLNYNGQEIDIGGAYETKIYNDQNKIWVHCPAKLETAQTQPVYGIEIPIVSPQNLIEYKNLLNGEHQKTDILAVKEYIAKLPPSNFT